MLNSSTMTKEQLARKIIQYKQGRLDMIEVMDAVEAYSSASNGAKPIVSGSLCCRCGIRSKKIGDMCISCKHGWTGRQHNDR